MLWEGKKYIFKNKKRKQNKTKTLLKKLWFISSPSAFPLERQKGETAFIHWFIPQMPAMTGAGLECTRGARNSAQVPTQSRKLGRNPSQGILKWDAGNPTSVLITLPNVYCHSDYYNSRYTSIYFRKSNKEQRIQKRNERYILLNLQKKNCLSSFS